jgi:uncharacterized protein
MTRHGRANGRAGVAHELFVDTSAWYPLARSSHADHARLSRMLRTRVESGARVVTTNLILAETHALLLARAGSRPALSFLRAVRQPPNEVVWSTAEIEGDAEEWLARYEDQDFSLTDAVSFQVMRERRIRDALTLDRHFGIAGFTIV